MYELVVVEAILLIGVGNFGKAIVSTYQYEQVCAADLLLKK